MNKKLPHNQTGAFYAVSVLIIVSIVIAIAVVIMAVYTDEFSGTDQNNIPLIGLKQETGYVLITSVHNGPVDTINCFAQILNKASGQYEGNTTINDGSDGQLDTGDTILIENISQGSYTVEIVIHDHVVGHCKYNIFSAK